MPETVTRLKHLATSTRDSFIIDPRIIKVEEGHNPRDFSLEETEASMQSLMRSIEKNGVHTPLWVRYEGKNKQAILVDGERRLRACLRLIAKGVEIRGVPAIQVEAKNEAERLLMAILANSDRKEHEPWELGVAYKKFLAYGWTLEEIAERNGKEPKFVRDALELADAPNAVKKLLVEESVTPAKALAVMRKEGDDASKVLTGAVKAAKAAGHEKVTRATPVEGAVKTRISATEAKTMVEALRGIIREFPSHGSAKTARTVLESIGMTW